MASREGSLAFRSTGGSPPERKPIVPGPNMTSTALKATLRNYGYRLASLTDARYCKCSKYCAAWADHPLGRRVTGGDYNKHLYEAHHAAIAAERRLPRASQRITAQIAGDIRKHLEPPASYLVPTRDRRDRALSNECRLSLKAAERPGWSGECEGFHRCVAREAADGPPFRESGWGSRVRACGSLTALVLRCRGCGEMAP